MLIIIIGDIMYISLVLKTLFLYFFIIICYRVMGKKELGQLSVIDLIVSILIADMAAVCIEETKYSVLISVVPIATLIVIQIFLSYISIKSNKFRNIVDGKPTVLINKGKVNFTAMSKLRYSLDDLTTQLREQGVKSLEEVDYAVLENSGTLSVFKNTKDYPLPLILDGEIDYSTLIEIKKDKKWVNKMLKQENIELKDVFYAFYTKDKTYIIKRNELL